MKHSLLVVSSPVNMAYFFKKKYIKIPIIIFWQGLYAKYRQLAQGNSYEYFRVLMSTKSLKLLQTCKYKVPSLLTVFLEDSLEKNEIFFSKWGGGCWLLTDPSIRQIFNKRVKSFFFFFTKTAKSASFSPFTAAINLSSQVTSAFFRERAYAS